MTELVAVVILGDPADPAVAATMASVDRIGCPVEVCSDLVASPPRWAQASYVSFVVAGDEVAACALPAVIGALGERPDLDLLYGDEDNLSETGRRVDPFHKPAWSPERAWGQDLLGSMVTVRSQLAADVVGEGAIDPTLTSRGQLRELGLVVGTRAEVVGHVPSVLCHRQRGSGADPAEELAVVERHFERIDFPARPVGRDPDEHGRSVTGFEPRLTGEPTLVSLVIPTGGSNREVRGESLVLVDNAIRSVVRDSTYQHFEIVVVVDATSTVELANRLAAIDPRVRIVKDERPFNFAAACNLGVSASTGALVVLLNDDTEIISTNWIERLVALTSIDDVGAVGVKLYYGDGRIQHGGVATRGTGPDHLYHGYPGCETGHGDWLRLAVNCFATTGACLAVRRDHWNSVDGMDEGFPLNYNDIDLCLRLAAKGWRTVVDNGTELTHLETSSRPPGSETWEVEAFRARWGRWLDNDPFDNPHLVTVGLLQVPPPPALTQLREYHGRADYPLRVWSAESGHELPTSVEA